MNREKSDEILGIYGRPAVKTNSGVVISFARQSKSDVEMIEKISSDELVKEWKSLCVINHFYGQISLKKVFK